MPLDLVGIISKVLGPIGRRLVRSCLISIEVVGGKYYVCTYERGDSPFVDVSLTLRVHNRNSRPTSLYAERFSAKPTAATEMDLPIPKVSNYGDFTPLGSGRSRIEIGASSTAEVTFNSRKYLIKDLPEGFLREAPLEVNIRIAETYGNHRDVVARADCIQILKQ